MYEIYIESGYSLSNPNKIPHRIILATIQGKAEAKREWKKLQKQHPEFIVSMRKCNHEN